MENALTRLHRAIDYALLATTSGSPDQRGALYARLARALTTQGDVNSEDVISQLPNFDAFREVLPILVHDEARGRKTIHPIWDAPDFIAPAIASLAVFFDRMTHPRGDSMFTVKVSRDERALYGFRLEQFTACAFDYSGDGRIGRANEPADWMRVSILLSGAALAFLKELSFMRFAPYYLAANISDSLPEGATASVEGSPHRFISLASKSNNL